MKRGRPQPGRGDHRGEIHVLDPQSDYLRIHQFTMLYDFPADAKLGANMAFYRVFSIPRIADLLVGTGEMTGRPVKRAYDTGLVISELIAQGFDHPRGREMVRFLGEVHRPWPIAQEDFTYVLCAFIVVPMRWIERRGWRPLLPAEREAGARFYRELGRRMGIRHLPRSYAEAAEMLDAFEARHRAPSPAAGQLMSATHRVVAGRLPRVLRRRTPWAISALLGEPPLSEALGLPRVGRMACCLVDVCYRLRNLAIRWRRPSTGPWFVPGQPAGDVYPDGYRLGDLGPLPGGPDGLR
ncbi:DUF2236 domain-containing protein [Nakamurella flava]|uniref:DUF2236 domain-containing protein n=1 Tax=Nakamurella flava TaxID=2576308 RepID=A0A4U6QK97_9ACTN|nr:oxygenase MpaB family protein [Nakamurella flava]TKV60873.1 DUF2236 domain-containing protein [Nakamurella flava]